MGFRKDAYCTIWGDVQSVSDRVTRARASTSRKDKQTGEYETDWSGFISFVGTATAQKALKLKEKDRIKLVDIDVTSRYDKQKDKTYTNYTVFTFELPNEGQPASQQKPRSKPTIDTVVDEEDDSENYLPF